MTTTVQGPTSAAPGGSTGLYPMAFGLGIDSEIPIPEIRGAPSAASADVEIRVGAVPRALAGATWRGAFQEARPGALLFSIPDVARFLVEGGRRITVESDEPASAATRLFLLGSAIGAILHQRGALALHASTIEVDGEAVAFAGRSGAGKSTLAHAFQQSGHKVLADDLTAVVTREGRPVVVPGIGRIKLWRDALARLGTTAEGHEFVRPEIDKLSLPLAGAQGRAPLPLARLYVLAPRNAPGVEIRPASGQERFHALRRETYRPRLVEALGIRDQHFRLCSEVASHVRVAWISRSTADFEMNELVAALRRDWAP